MPGTITLTSTGLILAETCESYPNGWTLAKVGTTTGTVVASSEAAHSGSKAFDFQTGADWPDSGYVKLTKDVDLKTGANRKVRFFRGLNVKGAAFDDFLGSTLKTDRWSGGCPVANSEAKVMDANGYYPLQSIIPFTCVTGDTLRLAARLRVGAQSGGSRVKWNPFAGPHDCDIDWGYPYAGDTRNHYVDLQNGLVATDNWPDVNKHVYECEFAHYEDRVLFWKDGVYYSAGYGYIDGSYYQKFLGDISYPKIDFYLDWVASSYPAGYKVSLKLGSQTLFDDDPASTYGGALPVSNNFFDECNGWATVTPTGSQTIEIKVRNASGYNLKFPVHVFFDDLVIMLDTNMTIKGLLGGQKIELYDSGGSLRKTATQPQSGLDVVFTGIDALIATAFGLQSYFKVYDTDGTTLLYTSPTESRWGGDVYTWLPNQSAMEVTATPTQIYRTGSGLSPTTSAIVATLTNKDTGAKLSGKTVYWTPSLGTVNPSNSQTDANGQATTTFTAGTSAGLGGVRGDFNGDATYGASQAQELIDIYYTQPVIDASKDFQAFIEGQDVVIAGGHYVLGAEFRPQAFDVVTPMMDVAIGGWWLVEIYRYGVLEFTGRIMTGKLRGGVSPQVTIIGVDDKITLQRRACNKGYTDEPKTIIEDLLVRYPCGISKGTIAMYGNTIKLDATYEVLMDALNQIANNTGWLFRLNPNRTLDYGSSFESAKNVVVEIGVNASMTDNAKDWSQIDSKVIVVGKGTGDTLLVSEASDQNAQLLYGLIEQPFLEKNISTQGTLDLRAQELLAEHKSVKVTIAVDFIDTNPTGTYGPFDTITVNDPDTGLSGPYQVYTLKRDLENADYAGLALTNAIVTIADALQALRKDVKDLGV